MTSFNVPRERESQTFYGMMDNFFDALSQSIEVEKDKIKEEADAYQKVAEEKNATEKKGSEIHVHIHTEADKKED